MGTNFYIADWRDHRSDTDSMDPEFHIGKRSAAGAYCWDCGITLCKGGNKTIHFSTTDWYKACPECGQRKRSEDFSESSVGRELGFNRSSPSAKTGVSSCSSFTWAIQPTEMLERITTRFKELFRPNSRKLVIEDEYGRKYSLDQFRAILAECPVQFEEFGKWFS